MVHQLLWILHVWYASQPTLNVVVLCPPPPPLPPKKTGKKFGRHCCTMKLCDTLNVKNALIQTVHYVTKYTFCNKF